MILLYFIDSPVYTYQQLCQKQIDITVICIYYEVKL